MELIDRPRGAPTLHAPPPGVLKTALRRGWADFCAAPAFGLAAGLACILVGWGLVWLTMAAGHTFWLVLAVFAFPLAAPFAAFGTYEVSRRQSRKAPRQFGDIVKVLWAERRGQLPFLSALIMVVLLFWFFLGHMIFALFLGLKPMTNIMSSLDVFLSPNGLMMIALGCIVGGGFALLLFAVCVLGLPMLLDRDVDYVTALIRSIGYVLHHPALMLGWAALIAMLLFLAMLPGFLGLLIVLPWLGHASWHVYAQLTSDAEVG